MFDPDDGWTSKDKMDSMLVPIEFEDLVAAQDTEEQWPFIIVCNRCGGRINYYFDYRNPATREFACAGRVYSYASNAWESCELTWTLDNINRMSLNTLRAYMCVEIYKKREKRYCLALEEHKGTTAYTYVRELTEEESWEEAKDTLQQLRQKIRNPKA